MYRRIFFALLLFTALVSLPAVALQNTDTVPPKNKCALILRDSTTLEKRVARIVADTLTKLGYTVKETLLPDSKNESASTYTISIVFSAIRPGNEVDPRIQKFMTSKKDASSRVMLFTVYGGEHYKKDATVDATTQATEKLHPDLVARRIIQSLKP
jgi:hypothetical protein